MVSNLLPWHPRRLNDEILSSWILRIAAGNNVSVRSLCAWLGNDQPVAALDRMAYTSPFIDSIAEAIGVEKEQVIECLPSSLHGLSRTPVYRSLGGAAPMPWRLCQGGSYGLMGKPVLPSLSWGEWSPSASVVYRHIHLLFKAQLLPTRKLSTLRTTISKCVSISQLGLRSFRKGPAAMRILQSISRKLRAIRANGQENFETVSRAGLIGQEIQL
ncbi:TniQ family protein [Tunturiibacter psychrotolerans]|uniref:TniQ family protein n=1 Tax=Tunturiibacter psychrotolerans TaxID=3069686 RepID=UPI003340E95C